jgi:hypothetical protein
VGVEHAHVGTSISGGLEVVHLLDSRFASVGWGEDKLKLSWLCDNVVLASVLISVGVSTNDDGLLPSWDESGDVTDDDGLTEDSTVENVTDSSVG